MWQRELLTLLLSRVGNKKTHPKNSPKKPTKNEFFGFFYLKFFNENTTNFSL
jgi:hypothetical protein